MPPSSGRLFAIMSTGNEVELHSRARASWKCSRARSRRPRRIQSAPKAEGRMQGVSPTVLLALHQTVDIRRRCC